MPNKLKNAKSPYLRQHSDNPVDWLPWGPEAFQKAKDENKPVFLSIGYATCHWCHVMAHESFEDPEIAELLNDAFINIKVDREERPDIDSTYMTVCQMLTGQGGWPLTIIMTPDKEPFFAGTYIPKEAKFNRIGLRQLIPGVKGMWENEPDRVGKATAKIREGFKRSQQFESGPFPGTEATDYAAEQLLKRYDEKHGGFGESPKFPSPHNLMFLLRQWQLTGEERFVYAVDNTLEQMRLGGIWDHVGFGFHRYSTDRKWLLPHFEKMLYDQALLMMAYTEAWQVTKKPLYKQTVFEIAEYLKRNLLHPEGGFYSAEDADSEGEEGKFYVWKQSEIEQVLGEEAPRFTQLFEIKQEGNFRDEATKKVNGTNIPHLKKPPTNEEIRWFKTIREKLFLERQKRTHPLRDEKILTDWNALMIAALAKAGFAFDEGEFIHLAENAFSFIEKNLMKEGKLLHRYMDEEAGIPAMADDFAFLIWAGIELYEATFDPEFLQKSIDLHHKFIGEFWDDEKGGFYLSTADEDQVYGRQKQIFDGAIPSANSVSLLNGVLLSRLTGNTSFESYTDQIGKAFSVDLIRSGSSISHSMQAIQFINAEAKEISLIGRNDEIEDALNSYRSTYSPFSVLHAVSENSRDRLEDIASYLESQKMKGDQITLYECENFTCDQPVTSLEEIKKVLA
ncbi:MAG: thioredoxin domain-containing protein [Gracilimonas sp.]|nr:thioredoxin domain-containing protein [Gracilimonas sp.]